MPNRGHLAPRRTPGSRRKLGLLGAVALLVLPLGAVNSEAAEADTSPAAYYLGVSGADLVPGQIYTPQQVHEMARDAGGSVTGEPAGTVQPKDVASGYGLFNPG